MNLEKYTLTWSLWLFALILVFALYFVLRLLSGTFKRVNLLGKMQGKVVEVLEIIMKLYEPLTVFFLLVGFIFINPFLHGLLVAFLFLLTFYSIKNYMNGRLFLLAQQLKEGQRIKVNETSGLIRKLGRLGVSLQTREGVSFINYTTLLSEGYMLLRGEKTGRLYRLLIQSGVDNVSLNLQDLNNKLFSCPYIDWSLRPEIKQDTENEKQYFAQVLVREEQHLNYLLEVIKAWGYGCRVKK